MFKYLSIWTVVLMVLNGCMMGPDYRRPVNHIPDPWVPQPKTEEVTISEELPWTEWWEVFEDPQLTCYVELARVHNNDVLSAEANFFHARAVRTVTASVLYPQVYSNFNVFRTLLSKNGFLSEVAQSRAAAASANPTAPPPKPLNPYQSLFNIGFDLLWEIDVFGKTRRKVESSTAQMEAAWEQRNDQVISIVAEVARNYMEIRSYQERITLTNENIELVEKSAQIVRNRVKSGLSTELDLERIEAELAQIRSTIPNIEASLFTSVYALSVLTGHLPETLLDEMLPYKKMPTVPSVVSIGIRSDILRRRPDIRQAERQLASATADIGVAVASFFPTFSIVGNEGLQSIKFNNLFQGNSKTWFIGGDIFLPIFEGGRLIGNLKASEANQCVAFFNYRKTVLNALQEAEGSYTSFIQDLRTATQLEDTMGRNEKIVKLSNERYVKGLVNLTDLLDSERQLISVRLNLLDAKTSSLLDLVRLYKALGGGWDRC